MGILSILVTAVLTALLTLASLYVASRGRLRYIFTTDSFKCGAVWARAYENPFANLNVTGMYNSAQDAGAAMHGCKQPENYVWGDQLCTLKDGKYACITKP